MNCLRHELLPYGRMNCSPSILVFNVIHNGVSQFMERMREFMAKPIHDGRAINSFSTTTRLADFSRA